VLAACGGNGGSLPPGVAAASGRAPALPGRTLDGAALRSLKGHVTVVSFWNPYCAPCRVEAPALESVSRRFAARGVVVVGVHYTGQQWPKSVADALSFVRAAHLTYPVVGDPGSALAVAFGIPAIPSTVIVDASGAMRFRILSRATTPVLNDLLGRVLPERGPGSASHGSTMASGRVMTANPPPDGPA
jgi:cytochrome c biogenesis protein CcmG, thiol:disulfide interchange protein DsbE